MWWDAGTSETSVTAGHADFYPEYCDLDINPFDYLEEGTTRRAVHPRLGEQPAVIEKYPVGSDERRTESTRDELIAMEERLERGGMAAGSAPALTSEVVIRAIDDVEKLL
jgi:hypothetical protein